MKISCNPLHDAVPKALAIGMAIVPNLAHAEVLHNLWALDPPAQLETAPVREGDVFLERRLLPVRMVRTTEAALGGEVPAGTPLYLVYNDAQQIGWCTVIDRSPGKAAKGFLMPIGNKRPCFTDKDGDGRLDATFKVYDLLQNPPKVGGSIADAVPMEQSVGMTPIDPHQYADSMIMEFRHSGKSADKLRVSMNFRSSGAKMSWQSQNAVQVSDKWVALLPGTKVTAIAMTDGVGRFSIESDPDLYIQRVRGGIRMVALPDFLKP